MLKKRLIATLIVREGIVVQSVNFRTYLPVGDPSIAIEFLNSWGIDEIVLLDITASRDRGRKDYRFIEKVSRSCFVPLTVGGGIDTIEDVSTLMSFGADKIAVNSHVLSDPGFITRAAHVFGSQCVVVSIDVAGTSGNDYRVYDAAQRRMTDLDPVAWARQVEARGAGEIYLTSVARDGSKTGFDLRLIDQVAGAVSIPVIASAGAGKAQHIAEVFLTTRASAVSAANFFHYSEHSVITTKALLRGQGVDIRLNTQADYARARVNDDGRMGKYSEDHLRHLLFTRIEKEEI